nr:MAG TPA: hypothetical protein [Caudoviricetes sp.]
MVAAWSLKKSAPIQPLAFGPGLFFVDNAQQKSKLH